MPDRIRRALAAARVPLWCGRGFRCGGAPGSAAVAGEEQTGTGERGTKLAFRVKLKFHEAEHEVHHSDQQSSAGWRTGAGAGQFESGTQLGGNGMGFGESARFGGRAGGATS